MQDSISPARPSKSILALAASCLLSTGLGCASGGSDITLEQFEQSGPLPAEEWALFVQFKPGETSGGTHWRIRADSSGELWAETRQYEPDRGQWHVESREVTVAAEKLVVLMDVVDVLAEAALPARVMGDVSHASSVRMACWKGSEFHAVYARGLRSIIEPVSREGSPATDPETVRSAAHVCVALSHVLQVWPSPDEWATSDYYADLAERAVAVLNEQR